MQRVKRYGRHVLVYLSCACQTVAFFGCCPFEFQVLVFSVTADEMSESRQTHVTLHDIDPQALEQLVQYAYTAEIMVGEGNVQVEVSALEDSSKQGKMHIRPVTS